MSNYNPSTASKRSAWSFFPKHSLNQAIHNAEESLLSLQNPDGYWRFELETDCSIAIEYALMMHFTGKVDELLQHKIANYLRRIQTNEGSFSLFPEGPSDISLTTKAYYVLKLAGDSANAKHMEKARNYVLSQGGASKCNVLTRITLATFEQLLWQETPFVPVEIILLPIWFPFNIYSLSYWARTVIVPLSILCTLRPSAKNSKHVSIAELIVQPLEKEQSHFDHGSFFKNLFLIFDRFGHSLDQLAPMWLRKRAIKKASTWIHERLNGQDGLGALMPAMLYAYEAMLTVGTPQDDPSMVTAKKALHRLLVVKTNEAYCQPAFSPVWDTAFSILALQESKGKTTDPDVNNKAVNWLVSKQLSDEPGDWRVSCPTYSGGGGWAFQYNSPHYPDIDDSAIAALAILQIDQSDFDLNVDNAARWIRAMQSKNGGYGAYDVNNTSRFLDATPLADYISLIDPPTADVSARCVMFLANIVKKRPEYQGTLDSAINFLWMEQEKDGSWFGRWGCNYIYGTWSVLIAMEQANISYDDYRIQRAANWLKRIQREDGGWGENNMTYHDPAPNHRGRFHTSTAFQSAWALLGLMAVGEVHSPEVEKGINFLLTAQQNNGLWHDSNFSGAGFPQAVYLKYHGYPAYFPLWALARYRNLIGNENLFLNLKKQ